NVLPSSAFRTTTADATDWTSPWSFTCAPRLLPLLPWFVCAWGGLFDAGAGFVEGRDAQAGLTAARAAPATRAAANRALQPLRILLIRQSSSPAMITNRFSARKRPVNAVRPRRQVLPRNRTRSRRLSSRSGYGGDACLQNRNVASVTVWPLRGLAAAANGVG